MGVKVDYANAKTVENLDTFYVTGAGYINRPFKGIARDSGMGWDDAVWGGDLTRTIGSFSFSNILDVSFGSVFRFEVNLKYMNEEDYIALRKLAHQRVFMVTGLNRDTGEVETHEMTFTKAEMTKLHAMGNKFYGGFDISITMVATNRDKAGLISNEYTISYNNNGGSGTIESEKVTYSKNCEFSSNPNSEMTKSGYHLDHWSTRADDSGEKFTLGQNVTIWKDYTLYAIWEANS